MYIYMNKEEDRILSKTDRFPEGVWSGDITCRMFPVSFKPILVEGTLWEKFCNLFSSNVMKEMILVQELTSTYFYNSSKDFAWVMHKSSGRVYRLWNKDSRNKHTNPTTIISGDRVNLPHKGIFLCEDFNVVEFI